MPWNQGPVTFGPNPSESRKFLSPHLSNSQPVLHSPQTPANTYTEPMDINMDDVTNFGVDSVEDWNMDDYLSNEYIPLCRINE